MGSSPPTPLIMDVPFAETGPVMRVVFHVEQDGTIISIELV